MFTTAFTFLLSLIGATTSFFAISDNALLAQATNAVTSAIVENALPNIDTLTITGNTGAPSSSFERTITFNGLASDLNGEGDITNVSLTAWRDGNTLGTSCATDPNQCYRIFSCTIDAGVGTDTETWYQCVFSIPQAYAYGLWHVGITATDLDNATGTRTEPFSIDAFSFETATTTETTTPPTSTTFGYYPPEEATTHITPTTSTGGTEASTDNTASADTATQGTDCIAAFYKRIEKKEPAIRLTPNHTEACSDSLRIAARDSGLLVFDVSDGVAPTKTTTRAVIVEFPSGASSSWLTLHTERISPETYAPSLARYDLVGDSLFSIYAEDADGKTYVAIPGAVRITLIIPEDMRGKLVQVYRYQPTTNTWVSVATEGNSAYDVTFNASELGIFAIAATDKQNILVQELSNLPASFIAGGTAVPLLGIALLGLFAILRRRRSVALIQGPMRSSPRKTRTLEDTHPS